MPPRKKPRLSDYAWWVFWAILMPEPILTDQKSLPRSKKCSATNPAQACPERLAAVRSGEMKPDFNMGAWVFTDDSPRRRITVEMKISGKHDHDLDPYSWYVCPWCGEELCSVYALKSLPQNDGNSD